MLHHIALICSERDRTVAFYEALGFHVTEEHVRPEKDDILILMSDGGMILELFIKQGCPARPSYPEAYGLRHLALKVHSAAQTAEKMQALGYNTEPLRKDTFTGETMTFVFDPDGLPVELHE